MENFIRNYSVSETENCKKAVQWFEFNIHKAKPGIVGVLNECIVDKKSKNSQDISMSLYELYTVDCFAKIFDDLWSAVQKYVKEFNLEGTSNFSLIEKINIQKYTPPEGGFKIYHWERNDLQSSHRFLVWMVYLNTIKDNGGTKFKYLNHTESAVEGKILIWPPDFTHTHKGVTSKTEEKYIITGWYSYI